MVIAKSNFRNGGDSLRGIEANLQVCPIISEITFGKESNGCRGARSRRRMARG